MIPLPWKILAVLMVVAGVGYLGYRHGYEQAEGAFAIQQNKMHDEYERQLDDSRKKMEAQETQAVLAQNAASVAYNLMKGERDAALKKTLVAVASGDKRLYVDAVPAPTNHADGMPEAPTCTGGTDAPVRVQLSAAAGSFLESLAGEADDLADLYRRCQQELTNDRKVCGQ